MAEYTILKDGTFRLILDGNEPYTPKEYIPFVVRKSDGREMPISYAIDYQAGRIAFIIKTTEEKSFSIGGGYKARGEWIEDRDSIAHQESRRQLVEVARYEIPLHPEDQARQFGGVQVVADIIGKAKVLFDAATKQPIALWSAPRQSWRKAKADIRFAGGIASSTLSEHQKEMAEVQGLHL